MRSSASWALTWYILTHTPSTAFRHLPSNSARFSYATEGVLSVYLRAAVQRRGQRPPKGSGTNMTVEATYRQSTHVSFLHETHPPRVKKRVQKSSVSIQTIVVLFVLV